MQENNQKETLPTEGVQPVLTEVDTVEMPEVAPEAEPVAAPLAVAANPAHDIKKYLLAALAVVVISAGLLFVLEQQGRISTGLFTITDKSPAALVNGIEIKRADYESSVAQLVSMGASQGASTTDAVVLAQFQTQAIETLVNGELLRQKALETGKVASKEAVDARLAEIEASVGGPELLAERMGEFKITEETLRRDIENEILIQALFDEVLGTEETEVTDAEVEALYDQAGGAEAGLPPLAEVREEIVGQIRQNQQQQKIAEYVETLKVDAQIEILI